MLMISCCFWALTCFGLLLQGDMIFTLLARTSRVAARLLKDNDAALFIIMFAGLLTITVTLLVFYKLFRVLLFLAFTSWSLAPVVWQPMHVTGFAVKYLTCWVMI